MALQPEIQYVPFYYVDGSAARKVERQPVKKATAAPAPKRRKARRKVVAVDPVALCGLVVAMVMLVMMVSGLVQYRTIQEKNQQLSEYVSELQQENVQLQQTYHDGYDLDEIREIADVVGMVPADSVQQIQIQVNPPQEENVEQSLWESFTTFLAGLFA